MPNTTSPTQSVKPPRADLQSLAGELLRSGKGDVFIGYEAATLPLAAAPLIIEAADPDALQKVGSLVFDARCEMNLVNYLHRHQGRRIAIVAKGCDCRAIAGLLQEKQVERENLVILGAPCEGVLDARLLAVAAGGCPLDDAEIRGGAVAFADGFQIPLNDVVYPGCHDCPARNPAPADYLIADPVPQPEQPEISPEVAKIKALPPEQRYEKFAAEMRKCILCYACRNLCPACYCRRCFADDAKPRVVSRTDDPADAMLFHLGRLMHLGGRCTGCGACVRGCPMRVDLRLYNDLGRAHVRENYDFAAGLDSDAEPPLACFGTNDNNSFVL